ncbi:MAG TPA: helix-turn-helix domain-containing protein, partial [Acidimicrobiia bacterium]
MPTRSTARDAPRPTGAPRPPTDERQRRADAARNRVALLDSARRVLSARGLEVPVEAIAREAGVGVGTVYRNFPTKEALLDAVITRAFEDLTAAAEAALERADPGDAFFEFLHGAAAVMARDRVLVWAARAQELAGRARAPVVERLFVVTDALLERAIAAGAVRAGIRA